MGSIEEPISTSTIPPPAILRQVRTGTLAQFGSVLSGINKITCDGPIRVFADGLTGDEHDLTFHGGVDKAIHQYCASHYQFWQNLFPQPETASRFIPGGFGENLVADELNESNVCIGDRVRIAHPPGSSTSDAKGVLLEVSLPRQPCFKLNHKFGIKNFAPKTHEFSKTGWYYRVIEEGWIEQGMQLQIIERKHPKWTIEKILYCIFKDKENKSALEELTNIPEFGAECRGIFTSRLQKLIEKETKPSKKPETWTPYRLVRKWSETPRITGLEFETDSPIDDPDEEIEYGSHVALKLPNGLRRSYSVVRGTNKRFELGVALDDHSRGGSQYLHQTARPNDIFSINHPTHSFSIGGMASHHILIAGGIGITAFLPMMDIFNQANLAFTMHYCVRDPADIAYKPTLATYGERITIHSASQNTRLSIRDTIRHRPWNSHIYICGPQRMLDEAIAASKEFDMSPDEIHYEAFQAETGGDPFTVEVVGQQQQQSRNTCLDVAADQSLLEALKQAGFDVGSSCEVGNCGSCRIPLVSGRVVHRGKAITEDEQKSELLSCVSRGVGHIVIEVPVES